MKTDGRSETSRTELGDDDENFKRELIWGHSALVFFMFVYLSFRISSFYFVILDTSIFFSINFQVSFISFAVKKTHSHRIFAGVALFDRVDKIYRSQFNLQCSQYYSLEVSAAVQMNAEFVCVFLCMGFGCSSTK